MADGSQVIVSCLIGPVRLQRVSQPVHVLDYQIGTKGLGGFKCLPASRARLFDLALGH